VADAGRELGDTSLPALVGVLETVQRDHPLRNGSIDLTVLRRMQTEIREAAAGSARARQILDDRPYGPLLTSVAAKVDQAQVKVAALDDALQTAAGAFAAAPAMLGADGPRTYFVMVQNNAEARATGGLIGAFALVRADRGRLQLERTGTNTAFQQSDTPVVALPGAARSWQDLGSTRAWFDANLTPHFPDVAQTVAGLWQRQSGQRVDGVLGVDPIVMSELLRAGGPVRLQSGASVTADNVVDFVGRREYVDFPDNDVRKQLLSDLAAQVFHRVVAAPDPLATSRALLRAAGSGHLFLWSRVAAEQRLLTSGLVGGALPSDNRAYLSVLTQNYGGDKLDFYLRREITVTRRPDGRLAVRIVLRNTAPLGLPRYMTVRADQPQPPVPYGQAKVGLTVYGALSTRFSEATVNGASLVLDQDVDHGHRLASTTVEVPRGGDILLQVVMNQPGGVLDYRQQPLVVPDVLTLEGPHRVVGR
jgi:hypothetical protein